MGNDAQDAAPKVQALANATEQTGNAATAATGSYVGWLLQMTEAQQTAERGIEVAHKNAEAIHEEGESRVALANTLGTETDKRQAAEQAAMNNLRATEAETAARQKYVDALKAEALGRAEALRDAGQYDAQRAKELVDLGQTIELAGKELDVTRARSESYRLAAAALQTERDALADNSGRVAEYAEAMQRARVAVEELTRAKAAGKDVTEQLKEAELQAAIAAAGYRDAFADRRAALEADIAVKKASLDVEAATVRSAIDQARASAAIARAKGDEAGASRFLAEAADRELQLAQLLAAAKEAEAKAALALVEAKREELRASGQLTPVKEAELRAAELGAKAKLIEADAQRQSARAARDLADAAQRSSGSSAEAGRAAGEAAGGFDAMGSAAERAAHGVERLTEAERALNIVKRPVSTSTIDHRQLAIRSGLTDEAEIAAFSESYGKRLQQTVTAMQSRNSLLSLSTPQSYVAEYAGAMGEARELALSDARQVRGAAAPAQSGGAPSERSSRTPANTNYSLHEVKITLPGGERGTVRTASESDSAALVGLLGRLGNDAMRAA